jgi:ribosomal 50S subunit-recycling heat shock protein
MGQALPEKSGGAILHAQGEVWVNGYEAHDSSAVFPGDVIETKAGSSANLSLDGSTVLIAPESVSKFQGDLLELDHGGVSVATSKSFKVRVNCMLVVPVLNDWTQYVVTDVNRTVQVAARKLDVNVDHERGHGKEAPEPQPSQQRASVHEGEQKSYDETEVCGPAARPTSALAGISPKWIAAGAAGAGILIWLLIHGGGTTKPQISPATP